MMKRTHLAVLLLALAACAAPHATRIRAVQHRGWWEIVYPDGTVSANELHIPAGRRSTIEASFDDPAILWSGGGHVRVGNHATLTFRGSSTVHVLRLHAPRFSELQVIADGHFDDWLARERRPAPRRNTAGELVFLTARCTLCHSVRGVAAAELPEGPDLTHVASRRTLAAGVLPNDIGDLSGWIVDPETLKPGAGMPVNNIDSTQLQSLVAYLRSLR